MSMEFQIISFLHYHTILFYINEHFSWELTTQFLSNPAKSLIFYLILYYYQFNVFFLIEYRIHWNHPFKNIFLLFGPFLWTAFCGCSVKIIKTEKLLQGIVEYFDNTVRRRYFSELHFHWGCKFLDLFVECFNLTSDIVELEKLLFHLFNRINFEEIMNMFFYRSSLLVKYLNFIFSSLMLVQGMKNYSRQFFWGFISGYVSCSYFF